MAGRIPLTDLWRLSGESVFPDAAPAAEYGLRLPGAEALSGFSALIGETEEPENAPAADRPFPLPALLPPAFPGKVTLRAVLPLQRFAAGHAELILSGLYGRGIVSCGDLPPRIFSGPTELSMDVTELLAHPAPVVVSVAFDESRPAGIDGGAALRLWTDARIEALTCDKDRVNVSVTAGTAGQYCLRLRQITPEGLTRFPEISLALNAEETRDLSVPVLSDRPGRSGIACELYREDAPRTLCDTASAPADLAGDRPACFVPLSRKELSAPPETLIRSLTGARIPAVWLGEMPSEALAGRFSHAGLPILCPDKRVLSLPLGYECGDVPPAVSPILSAYALCGLLLSPRTPSVPQGEQVLLREIAGRPLEEDAPGVQESLLWLRALRVRLLCEASRWGLVSGPLCAPGEWQQSDVREALAAALHPEHVSILPQMGAWWCGATFRAKLRVFGVTDAEAEVRLETEDGRVLFETAAAGGVALTAKLPDAPCVLTLHTRLLKNKVLLEEQTLPVYVGLRAPLEAAF